jgi:hypothetical protein
VAALAGAFMARRRPYEPAHIILNIETKNPIELTDFVWAFTSVASQYEKFIRSHYPEMSHDANIFIREVRAGSIEADLLSQPQLISKLAKLSVI